MSLSDQLMRMKSEIEEAKLKSAELEGQLKSLRKRAQEEFGCEDLASMKKLLGKMDKDLARMETQLEDGIKELKEKYDWEDES